MINYNRDTSKLFIFYKAVLRALFYSRCSINLLCYFKVYY